MKASEFSLCGWPRSRAPPASSHPFLMEYRSQDACRCVPDELKPDCNQSLRLITDRRPSLTVRLHGQVCSEPDVVSFHRADWSTWPGGRAKEERNDVSSYECRRANSRAPRGTPMRPVRDATNSRSFRSLELDRLRVVIRALARGGQRGQRVGYGTRILLPTNSVAFARAERICAGCPVAAECLATALEDRHSTESGWHVHSRASVSAK